MLSHHFTCTSHTFTSHWRSVICTYEVVINSPSLIRYDTQLYATLRNTTILYTTLQCNTLHYTTLHYTTLHYTTPHHTKPPRPLQLEKEFGLECCPMNWPIGDGEGFQGVLDRSTNKVTPLLCHDIVIVTYHWCIQIVSEVFGFLLFFVYLHLR